MPTQRLDNPNSIIARKQAEPPGEQPEKGLITLPGEADREIADLAGATYLTTKLDAMVGWARGNSLWPLPFGTACCAIEFMSMVSSHHLGPETRHLVVRRHHRHELDGAARRAERQRPERVAARPVDHRVELGGEVGAAGEIFDLALSLAGKGD